MNYDTFDWIFTYIVFPILGLMCLIMLVGMIAMFVSPDPCPAPNSKVFSHWEEVCTKGCYEEPVYNCVNPQGQVIGTVDH